MATKRAQTNSQQIKIAAFAACMLHCFCIRVRLSVSECQCFAHKQQHVRLFPRIFLFGSPQHISLDPIVLIAVIKIQDENESKMIRSFMLVIGLGIR